MLCLLGYGYSLRAGCCRYSATLPILMSNKEEVDLQAFPMDVIRDSSVLRRVCGINGILDLLMIPQLMTR